jgi:hypothetical protein
LRHVEQLTLSGFPLSVLFDEPVVNVSLGDFAAFKARYACASARSALYEHNPNGRRRKRF